MHILQHPLSLHPAKSLTCYLTYTQLMLPMRPCCIMTSLKSALPNTWKQIEHKYWHWLNWWNEHLKLMHREIFVLAKQIIFHVFLFKICISIKYFLDLIWFEYVIHCTGLQIYVLWYPGINVSSSVPMNLDCLIKKGFLTLHRFSLFLLCYLPDKIDNESQQTYNYIPSW